MGGVVRLIPALFVRVEPPKGLETDPENTPTTAGRAIEALEAAGVLVETTGKKRDRVYAYQAYLDLLRAGTELGGEG